MATLAELESALVRADQAGDEEATRLLAAEVSKLRTAPKGPQTAPSLVGPDTGTIKGLAIGAGRTIDRLLAGGKQVVNAVTGDQAAQEQLAQEQRFKSNAYKPLQNANPVSTNIGEGLPAALASIPLTGGMGPMGTIAMGGASAAVPEILSYGSPEERLLRGLKSGIGGAVGAGVGVGITKALQPTSAPQRIPQTAADAADRLGVNLTAAQKTQSPMLQNVENWLTRTPGYSSKMAERTAANQAAVNSAAASSIGQQADNVGEAVLQAAKDALGKEYGRLNAAANPDAAGNAFMNALSKVDAENLARGPYADKVIRNEVDKGLQLATQGKIPGTVYQEIRSALGDQAKKAFTASDDTLGRALKDIQKGLDDAAKDSLSTADQAALDLVRKQYSAYKVITKGQVAEAGNVSPARLATALRQTNPDAFRRGAINSPLMDIARLGEAVKGPTNPNSGSLPLSQMIFGNPLTGIPTMAANRAIGAAYMNPLMQGYLKSGALSPQMEALLLRSSVPAGLLGASAVQTGP